MNMKKPKDFVLYGQQNTFLNLLFIATLILFRVALDASYVFFVSPVYEYSGFLYEPSLGSYVFSWFLFLFSISLVSYRLLKVSDYFFIMALLALIAPLTSLYGLSDRDVFPVLVTIGSISIIYILTRTGLYKMPAIPILLGGRQLAVMFSVMMVSYLVAWYFYSGAIRYFNLDFSRVYEFRADSAELANVGVFANLNSRVYQVFSLFLFTWFLFRKKWLIVLLVFVIQVFFYGVAAHKSLLFYPFMIFGLWYYFRRTNCLIVVPLIFLMVFSVSLILYFLFGQIMPASMFIRRVFYVPAILTYDYFSFFSENAHVFWSNSVLSGFLSYPYEMGVAHVIGEYNGTGAGANNGFVSSGYGHAGLFGVLVYSVILSVILKVIDVLGTHMPVWFALAIVVVPLRSVLISSDLFTVMLTHGLLVALLLLIFVQFSNLKWVLVNNFDSSSDDEISYLSR
jgi:hypothetical protein